MIKRPLNSIQTLASFVFVLIALSACAQDHTVYTSPDGYMLTEPEKYYLSDALHEVSGITFPYKDSDVLVAIEDETGTVYQLQLDENKTNPGKFGKSGDYEGIAATQQDLIVLRSDGVLFIMPLANSKKKKIQDVIMTDDLIPTDEYEGLAVDPSDDLIYVLCKKCDVDKKREKVSGYIFEIRDHQPRLKGQFEIDENQIDSFESLKGKDFRPSALAKNQLRDEWYILSSINKMLVVADSSWNVKAVYPLNPKHFNQPEGIAFDADNNLFISNEGGDKTRKGTILKFNETQ